MSAADLSSTTGSFAELVAEATPAPGGGSAAAYAGELAASLGRMMCNLTVGKAKFAGVEPRLLAIKGELERLSARLAELVAEDAASFDGVMRAYRLPKETDEQKAERKRSIEAATMDSINTPLETAGKAVEVLRLLAELAEIGNPNALPDVTTGGQLARVAVKGAYYNIGVNLKSLGQREESGEVRSRITAYNDEAEDLARKIEARMISEM